MTLHGQPVARIVPITQPIAEMVAVRKVRPPRASGPLPPPLDLPSRTSSERAIDLLRGE